MAVSPNFVVPSSPGAGPLHIAAPDNQGVQGFGFLDDVLGTIPSLANAANEVDSTWGEIRELGGNEEVAPQPNEKNMATGPQPGGMGVAGITGVGMIVGVAAGVGIYLAGGNIAWAAIGGLFVSILLAFFMG